MSNITYLDPERRGASVPDDSALLELVTLEGCGDRVAITGEMPLRLAVAVVKLVQRHVARGGRNG